MVDLPSHWLDLAISVPDNYKTTVNDARIFSYVGSMSAVEVFSQGYCMGPVNPGWPWSQIEPGFLIWMTRLMVFLSWPLLNADWPPCGGHPHRLEHAGIRSNRSA